jgi:hypothetical protein
MIGGNGYSVDDPLEESAAPPRELYIRWLQANTFMPAMQFSFVPWAYDEEVQLKYPKKSLEMYLFFNFLLSGCCSDQTLR